MLLMRRDFTTDCVLSAAGLDFEFRLLVALQYKPSESDQCFDTTKLFITTAVTSTNETRDFTHLRDIRIPPAYTTPTFSTSS